MPGGSWGLELGLDAPGHGRGGHAHQQQGVGVLGVHQGEQGPFAVAQHQHPAALGFGQLAGGGEGRPQVARLGVKGTVQARIPAAVDALVVAQRAHAQAAQPLGQVAPAVVAGQHGLRPVPVQRAGIRNEHGEPGQAPGREHAAGKRELVEAGKAHGALGGGLDLGGGHGRQHGPLLPITRAAVDNGRERQTMARIDPHSHFDDLQPRANRWHLRLMVDFDSRIVSGEATLMFPRPVAGVMDLDTGGLAIHRVWVTLTGADVPWELGPGQPILGRRLRLELPEATHGVSIAYETSPEASGLQWLEPAQTEGRRHPFLFSQCQAIHARTLVPCQDSAVARVSYEAEVVVPEGLTAVMSAGPAGAGRGRSPAPGPSTSACPSRSPPTCWPWRWASWRAGT